MQLKKSRSSRKKPGRAREFHGRTHPRAYRSSKTPAFGMECRAPQAAYPSRRNYPEPRRPMLKKLDEPTCRRGFFQLCRRDSRLTWPSGRGRPRRRRNLDRTAACAAELGLGHGHVPKKRAIRSWTAARSLNDDDCRELEGKNQELDAHLQRKLGKASSAFDRSAARRNDPRFIPSPEAPLNPLPAPKIQEPIFEDVDTWPVENARGKRRCPKSITTS